MNANASSKNPKTTFTVFNQPPDFGNEFNQPGKAANKAKGKAIAIEKPNILTIGARYSPVEAAATKAEPTKGPVQEKETIAKAKAMNKIPIIPPLSACESTLLAQEFGSIISKAPKKEMAKTTNKTKKIMLNHGFVDNSFNASAPKITLTNKPITTYIKIIAKP